MNDQPLIKHVDRFGEGVLITLEDGRVIFLDPIRLQQFAEEHDAFVDPKDLRSRIPTLAR